MCATYHLILFADGGGGLQILRITANILNKQSQTASKGWMSNMRVGQGGKNFSL
jgi:hypothetical protein